MPRAGRGDARAGQRRIERHGVVLSDRSGRQCDDWRDGVHPGLGHQRRPLRHDARERIGSHCGHRRWTHHSHRRARPQVLGRLRPYASFHRQRRHARHHHGSAVAAFRHSRGHLGCGLPVSRPQERSRHGHYRDADRLAGRAYRIARRVADGCLHPLLEARRLRRIAHIAVRVSRHRGWRERAGSNDAVHHGGTSRQCVRMGDAAGRPVATMESAAQRLLCGAGIGAWQACVFHRCLRAHFASCRLPAANTRRPRSRGHVGTHRRSCR